MMARPVLVLDVDGVLVDSNALKQRNIREAATAVVGALRADVFAVEFHRGSGVTRERKIAAAFGTHPDVADEILRRYNALNAATLVDAPLTRGAEAFVERATTMYDVVAISGGAEHEVGEILRHHGLADRLHGIHGGPQSKDTHLRALHAREIVLFVGDSEYDWTVATRNRIPFVWMTGYTDLRPKALVEAVEARAVRRCHDLQELASTLTVR